MKVELHAEFEVWLSSLAESDLEVLADVVALLTALGEFGRGLGLPESKPIVFSRLDLFELRRTPPSSTAPSAPSATGPPVLRVLYGFCRNAADEVAVVVVGGDKTDKGNDWYLANVAKAEERLVGWCREDGLFSPVERRKYLERVMVMSVKQQKGLEHFRDIVTSDEAANARYVQTLGEIRECQSSIAELRKDLGLTQEQIAALLDVTQGAVSKMERSGSIETLQSLIEAMGGELHIMASFPGEPLRELTVA